MKSDRKVALITGAGKKRLGYHIGLEVARRGWAIALHHHSLSPEAADIADELHSMGVPVLLLRGDLGSESKVKEIVAEALSHFGRIDLLVNTASVWASRRLEEITEESLLSNFRVNTLSTFLMSKEAGLIMAGQPEGGSIITFGDWAIQRPYLDYADYFVSKGAIPTLTVVLAKELAARNPRIRVNCVQPGPVMVPGSVSAEDQAAIVEATVLQRLGAPENVVSAVFALVDNDFITGQCLTVDGGRTIA